MLIKLLVTYLRKYRGLLLTVVALTIVQTATRAPPGSFKGGRLWIGV